MIRIILGPCQGHFRLYLMDSTKVISSKVAKFGSMDIVELHGVIWQPWGGNLRPLVLLFEMFANFTDNGCNNCESNPLYCMVGNHIPRLRVLFI